MILLLVVSLVVSANAAAQYSDSLARNFMFPLSAAAYSNNPQKCLDRLFPNSTVFRQVHVRCDAFKKDNCSGFTAVLHPQKAIVLSFRGTMRLSQLLAEIMKTIFVQLVNSSVLFDSLSINSANDGFDNYFRIWSAGMNNDFYALREMYPDYEIWVTGHSLGGSIASLAASYLIGSRSANSSQIKLITFGQPRTGNAHFSENHNKQLEYSFRVTHWRDIVPHIPLGPIGGYYHHRQEAFYKSKMDPHEVKICSEGEALECSDGLWFAASIYEHTHYFGKHVSTYGVSGCVKSGLPFHPSDTPLDMFEVMPE
ncbi:unnamed protein product [Haemonchus placei]|uniref:Lipase_3 domain-containing protein n=1 Tax=Haemonchus placei TaxID=6290 RepID=A0A0N4W4G9_HAEPC|nr:unnamed protein product [Haemonchus placei]